MKTATWIRDVSAHFNGSAALHRLSEPVVCHVWDSSHETVEVVEWVVASAVNVPFSGPETYVFPANEDGEAVSFAEMEGSYRGGLDHGEALRGLGFEVASGELDSGPLAVES